MESLKEALSDPGPHTAESLAARLSDFPAPVIREALEALAAQGVLERSEGADGQWEYRYVAPDRYQQINMDVIHDPARQVSRRPR
jgi:predicted ArsR family transcriptional regulator